MTKKEYNKLVKKYEKSIAAHYDVMTVLKNLIDTEIRQLQTIRDIYKFQGNLKSGDVLGTLKDLGIDSKDLLKGVL